MTWGRGRRGFWVGTLARCDSCGDESIIGTRLRVEEYLRIMDWDTIRVRTALPRHACERPMCRAWAAAERLTAGAS